MTHRLLSGLCAVSLIFLFANGGAVAASFKKNAASDADAFRVTGFALHAETPVAEACVTFSAPVDLANRAAILAALDLRKDDKKEKIAAKDLSLTARDICVQSLDRRAAYRLALRGLESATGDALDRPFAQSFDVPDRKPFLAFVLNSNLPVLPRHLKQTDVSGKKEQAAPADSGAAHVLRSVNVGETHLTLFRMADRETFAGAWQQFLLSNLSPSESLYFAQTKGQKIFESDLVFGENPNVEQTLVAPLPSDSQLLPGLYYLAAAPKKQEGERQTLYAGQWFLVSSLRLTAVRSPDGIEAFAGDMAAGKPAADAVIRLLARDGRVLAEATAGHDGTALLRPDAQKAAEAFLLTGQTGTGEVDLIGFAANDRASVMEPLSNEAFVHPDQDVYLPGSTASVALRAKNADGAIMTAEGSLLKLLQPDRHLYSQQIVPADKDGVHLVNVSLPYVGQAGDWRLVWARADGAAIAGASVRIAADSEPRKLDLSVSGDADKPVLSVKASDAQGKPLPLEEGKIVARGVRPSFGVWKGYQFGMADSDFNRPLPPIPFMTGEDGTARVSLEPFWDEESGGERSTLDVLNVAVRLNQSGIKASLDVPLDKSSSLIGIRVLSDGRMFAENSVASFGVIAVDANGKRVAEGNLSYAIFEEGRSFEWFPSEGHWDYKPLPWHRRIGGGALSIGAAGEAVVRWPVAAGHYVLEIADDDGTVLARRSFDAGRVAFALSDADDGRLTLIDPPAVLEEKADNKIKLKLDSPAMVSLVAMDSRVRQTLYRFLPAGTSEIALSPKADWGDQTVVRLQALFRGSPIPAIVERSFVVRHKQKELPLEIAAPKRVISGGGLSFTVKTDKGSKTDPVFLSVLATPVTSESGGEDLPTARLDRVPVEADGKAQVRLNVPLFTGRLRLAVMAWDKVRYGEKFLDLSAVPALAARGTLPPSLLVGDRLESSLKVTNEAAPPGVYAYEMSLPSGVSANMPLKGKLKIGRANAASIALNLQAREETDGFLRLELTGPGNEKLFQAWPLAVRPEKRAAWKTAALKIEGGKKQNYTLAEKGKADGFAALLSPAPLPDIVLPLRKAAQAWPLTTAEIALWLELAQESGDALKDLGLLNEPGRNALRGAYLELLQRRQNEDGGFAALRAGDSSDMVSTAAAIVALRDSAERPVAMAVDWLTHKLQNTWFDESERAGRAVCFEALARAHRADLSGLRYFSETGKDKKVSPLTKVFIGLALEEGGDAEASKYWFTKAKADLSSFERARSLEFWTGWRLLSRSANVSAAELNAALEQATPLSENASFEEGASAVLAALRAAQKAGPWTASLNGKDIKPAGLLVLGDADKEERGKPQNVELTPQARLNVLLLSAEKKEATAQSAKGQESQDIQRQIFRLDGRPVEANDVLLVGEPYVLVLRDAGGGGGADSRLVLPQDGAAVFTAPESQAVLPGALKWLSGFPLSDCGGTAKTPRAIGLQFDASNPWRVALLFRPLAQGDYTLPSPRLLSATGQSVPLNVSPFRAVVR